jgi:hypothetical protein
MTPSIAIIHLDNPHWQPFWRHTRLWIPLFLLWIPFLLLLPLIVLAIAVACWLGRVGAWRGVRTLWGLICALPGTDVRVSGDGNQVLVRIL